MSLALVFIFRTSFNSNLIFAEVNCPSSLSKGCLAEINLSLNWSGLIKVSEIRSKVDPVSRRIVTPYRLFFLCSKKGVNNPLKSKSLHKLFITPTLGSLLFNSGQK